jgi:hypothetical protein
LVLLYASLPDAQQLALALKAGCMAVLADARRLAVVANGRPGEVRIGVESITTESVYMRSQLWHDLSPQLFHLFSCSAGRYPVFIAAL